MRLRTLSFLVLSILAAGCNDTPASPGAPDATSDPDLGPADMAAADTGSRDQGAGVDGAQDLGNGPDATDAPDDSFVDAPDDLAAETGTDAAVPTIGELCFSDRTPDEGALDGPQYDQFGPRVGAHCLGTNHQHIWGIEQVVFLGDSVTVGTPPSLSADFYRTRLANALAAKFNLQPPAYLWQVYDPINGTAGQLESGSFKSCAKWGARTDDLLLGGEQIAKCFPDGGSDKRTLIIMTIGGNDISALTKAGGTDGEPLSAVQTMTEQAVADLEAALVWLKDPARFPAGSFVVFANPFEFTDGTGKTEACLAADLADLEAWDDPDALASLVIWLNEQWMRIAVDTRTDMIFMLEHFCGHGFVATGPNAEPDARCYLGADTERWFDDTCIHPNPTGHGEIASMFMEVVNEVGTSP